AWAYADGSLLAAEREQLLRAGWQLVGHEAELRAAGDFLTADLAGERALVLRDEGEKLHALRNTCRRSPHALVTARKGHLKSVIHCAAHGLTYTLDGRLTAGTTPGDLAKLDMMRAGRLIRVRAGGGPGGNAPRAPGGREAGAVRGAGAAVAHGLRESDGSTPGSPRRSSSPSRPRAASRAARRSRAALRRCHPHSRSFAPRSPRWCTRCRAGRLAEASGRARLPELGDLRAQELVELEHAALDARQGARLVARGGEALLHAPAQELVLALHLAVDARCEIARDPHLAPR